MKLLILLVIYDRFSKLNVNFEIKIVIPQNFFNASFKT